MVIEGDIYKTYNKITDTHYLKLSENRVHLDVIKQ